MRRIQFLVVAVVLLPLVSSCVPPTQHAHENWYRRHHGDKPYPSAITAKWCQGLRCHRVMTFNKYCQAVDDSGTPITELNALIGTHICFYNNTGCPLVLKFGNVLFGATHATTTIATGDCATLIVTLEAAKGVFSIEPICDCVDGGHTNPTVRVGDEEEEGGGG